MAPSHMFPNQTLGQSISYLSHPQTKHIIRVASRVTGFDCVESQVQECVLLDSYDTPHLAMQGQLLELEHGN